MTVRSNEVCLYVHIHVPPHHVRDDVVRGKRPKPLGHVSHGAMRDGTGDIYPIDFIHLFMLRMHMHDVSTATHRHEFKGMH